MLKEAMFKKKQLDTSTQHDRSLHHGKVKSKLIAVNFEA